MLTDNPHIPPAILLLLTTLAGSSSWDDHRRRIKGLLPDLRAQSEVFDLQNAQSLASRPIASGFAVHLHGALDLFSGLGCGMPECRIKAADQLARSFGLIADEIWLTDTLSRRFVNFGRVTNAKLDEVVVDTLVLSRLLPLLNAGIVRFRSPWLPSCSSCAAEFERQLVDATDGVRRVFRRDFRVEDRGEGNYVGHTGRCYEPPLVYRAKRIPGMAIPTSRTFASEEIARSLRGTFRIAREASLTKSTLATNCRVGIAGLLEMDGRLIDKRSLLDLERQREISVPWVTELTAEQILQLREEASHALPAFRELMARALSPEGKDGRARKSEVDVVAGLRDQAQQVRAELSTKRKYSGRFWKTTYGLLGFGLSAYGVATDQVAAGVAGLLPLIQLLLDHKKGYEAELALLRSRPGFVLVKAHDILAHAHSN